MNLRALRASVACVAMVVGAGVALGGPEDRGYRAGIGLLNKGMHEAAAGELRTFLKEHPDSPEALNARYALGVCLSRMGDTAGAAAELDRVIAVKEFAFRADAMLLRAHGLVSEGKDQEAGEMLERLVADHGESAAARGGAALAGEMLYRQGRYSEARRVLERVTTGAEGDAKARAEVFTALCVAGEGDDRGAIERFEEILKGGKAGVLGPTVMLAEARCRHRLGDLASAARLYGEAGTSGEGAVKVEAKLGGGQVAREAGRLQEAAAMLNDVIAMKPGAREEALARLELGRLALDGGKIDEAREQFAAVGRAGEATLADDAAYWVAKCDLRAGKNVEAARALTAAAKAYPSSELMAEMKFDAASALARGGQDKQAVEAWEAWRKEFKGHSLAVKAAAAEAGSLQKLGQHDLCVRLCDMLLRVKLGKEDSANVRLLKGESLFLTEKYDDAAKVFGEVAAGGEGAAAWRAEVRRGMCLLKTGAEAEGERVLAAALEKGGEDEKSLRAAAISQIGERRLAAEDWQGAQARFGELVELVHGGDGEGDALLRLGVARARGGKQAEAVEAFDKAIAVAKSTGCLLHARFEKGQSLVELGKQAEAGREFEAVIEGEKKDGGSELTAASVRHLAAIASKGGDSKRAAELLGEIAGSDADAAISRGMALISMGNYGEAGEAFATFLREHGDHPRSGEARAMAAICLNREGRHEEAVAALEEAERSGLKGATAGAVLYEKALALRALGKDDDAAKAYGELLGSHPEARLEAYAALDLSQVLSGKGDHEGALKLVERCDAALGEAPPADVAKLAPRSKYARGVCLLGMGRAKEAAGILEAVEKAGVETELAGPVRSALGEALLKCGRAADAVEVFAAAVDAGGDDAIVGGALLRLGEACAGAQLWKRSEEAYTRYLERFGTSELWFQARFGQGWARENEGRHDAAIEAYREVVDRHQGQTAARAQFQIGECLYAQKKHGEAAAELLKVDVLYAYPEWTAAALYEAGRCLLEMNKTAEAGKQFDEVMTRFPESSWAKLAKERKEAARPTAVPGKEREVTRAK